MRLPSSACRDVRACQAARHHTCGIVRCRASAKQRVIILVGSGAVRLPSSTSSYLWDRDVPCVCQAARHVQVPSRSATSMMTCCLADARHLRCRSHKYDDALLGRRAAQHDHTSMMTCCLADARHLTISRHKYDDVLLGSTSSYLWDREVPCVCQAARHKYDDVLLGSTHTCGIVRCRHQLVGSRCRASAKHARHHTCGTIRASSMTSLLGRRDGTSRSRHKYDDVLLGRRTAPHDPTSMMTCCLADAHTCAPHDPVTSMMTSACQAGVMTCGIVRSRRASMTRCLCRRTAQHDHTSMMTCCLADARHLTIPQVCDALLGRRTAPHDPTSMMTCCLADARHLTITHMTCCLADARHLMIPQV